MTEFRYILKEEDRETPLRIIIKREFHFSSRLMTKIKYSKNSFLNGESVPMWVTGDPGDEILVKLPEEKSDFEPEDIPLTIIYEDNDVLVINKQPYIVVHPTKGHPIHTIANGVQYYMNNKEETWKIRFVNRLDMDTSGLLIIGKNSHTQDNLMKQMKTNTVQKKYYAIVMGHMKEEEGTIDAPIGRPDPENVVRGVMKEEDGGYPSVTHYKVLEHFKDHTFIELILETGRTHQIRVHMSYIGHPILGDPLYGGNSPLIDRQALHAHSLSFRHPVTGDTIELEAPLLEDMENLIKQLR